MLRRGFTLIELLVVITIIIIVSAVAMPTVLSSLNSRQSSEAARLMQASLAGARDAAIRDNASSGIRLLLDPQFTGVGGKYLVDGVTPNPYAGILDPTQPLAANRLIPIGRPPSYTEGLVSAYPGTTYVAAIVGTTTPLVLEESPGQWIQLSPASGYVFVPNAPTSWAWNIRVGDQVQINNAGPWYTVVGPMAIPPQGITIGAVPYANNELFVNWGPPGGVSPLSRTITSPDGQGAVTLDPEFLLLVNGRDDNDNGWIDEGWDGVDNNADGVIDNPYPAGMAYSVGTGTAYGEWERETWVGSVTKAVANQSYTIKRRPAPLGNAREVVLPTQVVIDLTTWATTQERSRLPVDPYTGYVDLVVNPNGTVVPALLYSSPASVGLSGAFVHFWLADRSDVTTSSGTTAPTLAVPRSSSALVTLSTRTGRVSYLAEPASLGNPFAAAEQGVR